MAGTKYLRWKILAMIVAVAVASLAYVLASQVNPSFHGIGVLKSADPFAAVGDAVNYTIVVYNPSSFDLHNITVIDGLINLNETIPFMAAGNKTGVTYVVNRTVLESDPNPLVNTVSVEAVDFEGLRSTASTQAKTTIIKRLIDIKKTGPLFAHEGDAIKYTISVRSLADSPIANVTVTDEKLGFSWIGKLDPEEYDMFNLTYVVPMKSEDPLTNTATVSAMLNESSIYAQASWTVDILHPKLAVNKTITPPKICEDGNATYKITATNAGDATLFNLTLVDSIYGPAPAELTPSSLSPGESFAWVFNATLGRCPCICFRNIATATGVDALGKNVSASSKPLVIIKPCISPKSIGFWKNHPEAWPISEIKLGNVTYTKEEALKILEEASARDATRMLAAQLLAAKLNKLSNANQCFHFDCRTRSIDSVINEADAFLIRHPLGSNPEGCDREAALRLKDVLEAYNESECEWN